MHRWFGTALRLGGNFGHLEEIQQVPHSPLGGEELGECEGVVMPCYASVDVEASMSWAMKDEVGRVVKPIVTQT